MICVVFKKPVKDGYHLLPNKTSNYMQGGAYYKFLHNIYFEPFSLSFSGLTTQISSPRDFLSFSFSFNFASRNCFKFTTYQKSSLNMRLSKKDTCHPKNQTFVSFHPTFEPSASDFLSTLLHTIFFCATKYHLKP